MVRKRNQHGSMRVLSRKSGDVFEYRYYRLRADGKRVPANFVVGPEADLKTEAGAWAKLRRMNFDPNAPTNTKPATFGELAKDYIRVELATDQSNAAIPKAHSTVETYRRYINRHILPRWEMIRASDMEPVAVQNWLRDLCRDSHLSNPTLVKVRNVMVAIFKHTQRYGLLPRTQEANPMLFVRQSSISNYEPAVLTLSQCVHILANLTGMHRVRKPVRPKSVTHVTGTFCNPCPRAGPQLRTEPADKKKILSGSRVLGYAPIPYCSEGRKAVSIPALE